MITVCSDETRLSEARDISRPLSNDIPLGA